MFPIHGTTLATHNIGMRSNDEGATNAATVSQFAAPRGGEASS